MSEQPTQADKRQQAEAALNAVYSAACNAPLPAQQHIGLKQAAEFLAGILAEAFPDEEPEHQPDHYDSAAG